MSYVIYISIMCMHFTFSYPGLKNFIMNCFIYVMWSLYLFEESARVCMENCYMWNYKLFNGGPQIYGQNVRYLNLNPQILGIHRLKNCERLSLQSCIQQYFQLFVSYPVKNDAKLPPFMHLWIVKYCRLGFRHLTSSGCCWVCQWKWDLCVCLLPIPEKCFIGDGCEICSKVLVFLKENITKRGTVTSLSSSVKMT